MQLRRVDTGLEILGSLWLGPMPGRFETWAEFNAERELASVALVLCLTPREEIALGAPAYHRAIAEGKLSFRWLHVPMRNYGLPADMPAFRDAIAQVEVALVAASRCCCIALPASDVLARPRRACSSNWGCRPSLRCSASARPGQTRKMRCSQGSWTAFEGRASRSDYDFSPSRRQSSTVIAD